MRENERDRASADGVRGEPAEPAKVHGDVLEEKIPREPRESERRHEADGGEMRKRREESPGEG